MTTFSNLDSPPAFGPERFEHTTASRERHASDSGHDVRAPANIASAIPLSLRESDRAMLRPLVGDVDSSLLMLLAQADSGGSAGASAELAESWKRLVAVMALGVAPALRACPFCQHRIAREATRCVQCWKQSPAERA